MARHIFISRFKNNNLYYFQLPIDFSIGQILDIFFKAHVVLNMKFDPSLNNMMMFLQSLIYKFEEGSKKNNPTAQMFQIFDEFNETE